MYFNSINIQNFVTDNMLVLILSFVLIIVSPIIGYILGKKKSIKAQDILLKKYKYEIKTIKEKNQQLLEDAKNKNKENDNLIDLIKEQNDIINMMEEYERIRKRKHRESVFIQTYKGLDDDKEETTDIIAAHIFSRKSGKRLTEKEKQRLVEKSSATENKESDLAKTMQKETFELKKQLDNLNSGSIKKLEKENNKKGED